MGNCYAHCPECGARMGNVCQECGFVSSCCPDDPPSEDDRHWVDEDREDEYFEHPQGYDLEWDDRCE